MKVHKLFIYFVGNNAYVTCLFAFRGGEGRYIFVGNNCVCHLFALEEGEGRYIL